MNFHSEKKKKRSLIIQTEWGRKKSCETQEKKKKRKNLNMFKAYTAVSQDH